MSCGNAAQLVQPQQIKQHLCFSFKFINIPLSAIIVMTYQEAVCGNSLLLNKENDVVVKNPIPFQWVKLCCFWLCLSPRLLWEETLLDSLLNFAATPKGLLLLQQTGAINECVSHMFSRFTKKLQVITDTQLQTLLHQLSHFQFSFPLLHQFPGWKDSFIFFTPVFTNSLWWAKLSVLEGARPHSDYSV